MARHCQACGAERSGDVCQACGFVVRPPKLSAEEAAAKFAELRRILKRDVERDVERVAIQVEGSA